MEDLKAMSYLERVIKETMRLYPSVTGITRTLTEPLRLGTFPRNAAAIHPSGLSVLITRIVTYVEHNTRAPPHRTKYTQTRFRFVG